MGVSAFGGCDNGIKWSYDDDGNICVAGIPNCITGEDLKIPGIPEDKFTTGVISEDGSTLTLENLDGVPGTVNICLNPTKGAVIIEADGGQTEVPIVDGILQLQAPEEPEEICWGLDENGCPVLNIKNCITGEDLVIDAVQEVTGNVVNNVDPKRPVITAVASVTGDGVDGGDGQNPVITQGTVSDQANGLSGIVTDWTGAACEFLKADAYSPSSTEATPAGFHTITTSDGVATPVCLNPLKSVNGITGDINGNVNIADLFSNTVDNGNGTFTTTNSDGSTVTWSGDTFATQADNGDGTVTFTMSDGSSVTLCLNPVKSIIPNDSRTGAVVTYADGTTQNVTYTRVTSSDSSVNVDFNTGIYDLSVTHPNPIDNTVALPEGFHTITTSDGVSTAVCLNPLKSINGITGDINGNVVLADLFTNTVDNGDGTFTTTNSDGSTVTWSGDTFASQVDNGDGTVTFTMADGSTVTLCLNPVKNVVQNVDNLGASVVYADGTTGTLTYPLQIGLEDQADGTALDTISNCLVSTERTSIECTAPGQSPVYRTTDLKTGAVVDVAFPALVSPQRVRTRSFQLSEVITAASTSGIVGIAPEVFNFTLPCEQDLYLELTAGWSSINGTQPQGEFDGRFMFSLDGGAFTPLSGNATSYKWNTPDNNTETQHTQFWRLFNVAAGAHTIQVQFELLQNELSAGDIANNTSLIAVTYNDVIECC